MNNIKKNVEKKFKRNIEFPFILLVLILHFLLHYATICTLLQLIVTLKKIFRTCKYNKFIFNTNIYTMMKFSIKNY